MPAAPAPLRRLARRLVDSKPASWQVGRMKMTIDLPSGLVRDLKLRATHEGRELKELAVEFFQEGLSQAPTLPPAKGSRKRVKLPLFECSPDAPASRMTADELIKLEQETLQEEGFRRAGISL